MEAPDYCFPRNARLLSGSEFKFVFESAERSSDRCYTVLARRSGEGRARLGLAVSKKHLRRAVDRNRVKRIARESFRLVQKQAQGIDFIVLARNTTIQSDNSELHSSLQRHWRRLLKKLVHDTRPSVL